ncbi:EAL domain-containing protein [Sinomonas sp. P47F7]|uniref:EAL domain-containing protein n=1 Tax=Sinomonas sp. P47F7 TaxID=3410987 RepID=UPI003BF4D996
MSWTDSGTSKMDLSRLLPEIDEAQAVATRESASAPSLLLVDLPSLSGLSLNSSYRVTAAVIARLHDAVAPSGNIAVVGEGRLAVLVPGTGPRRAAALARRVERCIEDLHNSENVPFSGPASVRIHQLDPGASAQDALALAGVALDAVAEHALPVWPTRAEIFDSPRPRVALADDLDEAVHAGRIGLAYQPIVGLQTGRIIGVEVLARWQHPSLGDIPPLEFVPLAHEIGVAGELGRLVLESALTQLTGWRNSRAIGSDFVLSVNTSADQLRALVGRGQLQGLLSATGTDPQNLALELTEESFVAGAEQDVDVFTQLHGLGVGLHIDDFGTGYSSIGYLRRLPAALVKIDRTLLGDLAGDPREQRFIRAILDMVGALDLGAVFEGVETRSQARELSRLGAAMAQGYHFSRPLPAATMTALLGNWNQT